MKMIDALTAKDRIPTQRELFLTKKAILKDFIDEIDFQIETYKVAQDDIIESLYYGQDFISLFRKFIRGE
jgi:hypothetical protein